MFLFDVLGLGLTLLTLALLALGGYLLALRMLSGGGDDATADPLGLAIATLLAASAEAVGIGLLLGALGILRLELGLAVQTVLVLVLLRGLKSRGIDPGIGGRLLLSRTWEKLRQHPAFSLLALHAVGSEALRGLLRPPLSWDSLMYHLMLTARWLQERNLKPVFGPYPVNDYGFVPANGSVWLWWWMAPSHSELYVNLAFLPHWLLLGLATGGIARQLGARRHWPLAAFLVLVTPTVVRFAATPYVDVFLASVLLGAGYFAIRWMRVPRSGDAALAGFGLGLASGAKLLGVPYAIVLAGMAVLGARGDWHAWRRRTAQVGLAVLLAAALGSYFYLRNVAYGAGPLAIACEGRTGPQPKGPVPALPRPDSVLDRWETVGKTQVLDAFLGITRPQSIELGAGPQVLVLLLAFLALPFALPGARWESWLVAAQIGFELLFWLVVPFAANFHVFANIRYLVPALGLAFAGGVAIAETRAIEERWLTGIAFALACQGLLQLHAEMPHGVRIAVAAADLAAVALAFSPSLRELGRRRARALAATALVLALLCAPLLARFRVADRPRALATEWTSHSTSAKLFAGGWGWLDQNGGDGTVDVVGSPGTYFVYPAMGPYLGRKAVYVNVNRANLDDAAHYPKCDPRVDPSPAAWAANLAAGKVRWLLLCRYPEFDFPLEERWAQARPDLFALRYRDETSLVIEFLPEARRRALTP
ncbi:MAG: hypothetical protein QOJ16_2268 [Acidobacteriota bacterium]|jgi:hypothetical protein|nr:hypothetical protein [Acidobacteriota bacterium]